MAVATGCKRRAGIARRARAFSVMPLVFAMSMVMPQARAVAASTLTVPGAYPTIQAALDAAVSGDVVSVAPGTYRENVNFHGKDVRVEGTGGASVTVILAPGGTAVTIGPAGSIVGLTISGGSASFGAGMAVSGAGTLIAHDVFESNAEGSGGYGAAIGGNGASPTIEQNVFDGNSCDSQFLSGVVTFVNGSSPLIANNVFRDNPCRAVNLTLPNGFSPLVVNNTIVRNSGGIEVDGSTWTVAFIIRNNIVWDNGAGLEVDFGVGPTWDHNLVYGNTTNYVGVANQTGLSGNLSVDPQFVDAAANNFHLLSTSPAAGAGTIFGAPAADFDGLSRAGQNIDIGAFAIAPFTRHQSFNCTLRAANGKYVSTELGYVGALHGALRARAAVPGPWEKFTCVAVGTNQWALQSRANGQYVSVQLAYPGNLYGTLRAGSASVSLVQKFTVSPMASCARCFALRSAATLLYVSTEMHYPGSTYGLARARATRPDAWETYVIAPDPS